MRLQIIDVNPGEATALHRPNKPLDRTAGMSRTVEIEASRRARGRSAARR
jgi:hypothetical protein